MTRVFYFLLTAALIYKTPSHTLENKSELYHATNERYP